MALGLETNLVVLKPHANSEPISLPRPHMKMSPHHQRSSGNSNEVPTDRSTTSSNLTMDHTFFFFFPRMPTRVIPSLVKRTFMTRTWTIIGLENAPLTGGFRSKTWVVSIDPYTARGRVRAARPSKSCAAGELCVRAVGSPGNWRRDLALH